MCAESVRAREMRPVSYSGTHEGWEFVDAYRTVGDAAEWVNEVAWSPSGSSGPRG
jgi:hypothetical protein